MNVHLPPELEDAVAQRITRMQAGEVVGRIWQRDHTVWSPDPTEITDRLGWLTVFNNLLPRQKELQSFADHVKSDGLRRVVLLGMGGSSLAPEVYSKIAASEAGIPLTVVDTTHPSAIVAVEKSVDLATTLFVVASKSGGTIETLSHMDYFFDKIPNGDHFVAITDSGSGLEKTARERKFRELFVNPSDIGGRYSALSLFGLVPASLVGADIEGLTSAAQEMANECSGLEEGSGAWLGSVIGEAAIAGRDKLTILLPREVASFGDWAEQLIAESTGKSGKGIVPVVGEPVGSTESYGDDRLFISFGGTEDAQALADAGHPVIVLPPLAVARLGAEFFRFEFAVAVAGYVLGINPFDQPNVAEAKAATKRLLDSGPYQRPGMDPLQEIFASIGPGDYVALQAYLPPTDELNEELTRLRVHIRDRLKVATTSGYGPRYLHSTGQLHKGGPTTGVFIQLVDEEAPADVVIPQASFTFGGLIRAQADGDMDSLRSKGLRVARTTLTRLRNELG